MVYTGSHELRALTLVELEWLGLGLGMGGRSI